MSKLNSQLWNVIPYLRHKGGGRSTTQASDNVPVSVPQNSIEIPLAFNVIQVAEGDIISIYQKRTADEVVATGYKQDSFNYTELENETTPLFCLSAVGICLDN